VKKRSATSDAATPDPANAELPEGWTLVSIRDIAEINPRHPKGLDDSMRISFAPMAALSETGPAFDHLEERPYGEVRKGFTHFGEGDVLFAKITPCMENGKGAVATCLRNGIGCGTTELHVLRPRGGIDAIYLYRFLSQYHVRRDAKETFTSSAGQARVPSQFLTDLEIPLPPLAEQKRIVVKVEELLARVNATRDRLAKVSAILKRFRQSVLAAACSGRLTEEWQRAEGAPDWEDKSLGEMAKLVTSGSRGWAKHYADSGPIFIRAQNLSSDCLDLSDVAHVQLPDRGEGTRTLVSLNDILVTITGANVTKTAIVFENIGEAYVNQHVALVRLHKSEHAPYVWLWLISPDHGRSQLLEAAYGAGKPGLNLKQVRALHVRLPHLPEQHEIVRRVEGLFALADSIEKQVAAGMARAEKLTQAILAKAFRGGLVPQDSTDESASVLLERIRIARTAATETQVRRGRISGKRKVTSHQ